MRGRIEGGTNQTYGLDIQQDLWGKYMKAKKWVIYEKMIFEDLRKAFGMGNIRKN